MIDRRRFWSDATEAEIAEACRPGGLRLIEPLLERIVSPVADLCKEPHGMRERQLLRGQGFTVRAVDDSGWAFGESLQDSYSGWVDYASLAGHPTETTTHWVSAPRSYAKTNSGLKTAGDVTPLSLGAQLIVLDMSDGWARVAWMRGATPRDLFVPSGHLTPLSRQEADPVAVAERLIGAPYLWGGNSAFGIDCSGLVQIACHACGIDCPGDSDMQEAVLGETLGPGTPPERGDLMFWKGHVAWVADRATLIHANAHHMAVAYEPAADAIARIEAQGDGPVTRHARLRPVRSAATSTP